MRENETAESLVSIAFLPGQVFQIKNFFEFVHAEHAVEEPGAVFALHSFGICQPAFEGNIAGDRLEDVVLGEKSFDAAVLIDDQGEVLAGFLERFENFERRDRARHEQGLMSQSAQIEGVAGEVVR